MLRTRDSLCLPAPHSASPLNRNIVYPKSDPILHIGGGRGRGARTFLAVQVERNLYLRHWKNYIWEAQLYLKPIWMRSLCCNGMRLRGTVGARILCMWSAAAASLQWPPPTLSSVGSVTNMRHEWWCVTSKIRSQKTVLSLGSPLSCYSPDQQLYWDSTKDPRPGSPTWAGPKIPSPQTLWNSLEVICHAATANYSRAEGGERRLEMKRVVRTHRTQGTPLKGFCILFYQKKEQFKNFRQWNDNQTHI